MSTKYTLMEEDGFALIAQPEEYWTSWISHKDCLSAEAVIAANAPPNQLGLLLADLSSRLTWGMIYQVKRLTDGQLALVLQQRADERGIRLSDEVAGFLLKRCPRDPKALFGLLDTLDQASMLEQRRVTIPFVKQVLGI